MLRNRVFVDTSAWHALVVEEDRAHGAAQRAFASLLAERGEIFTSNHIIGETYTLLRAKRGYRQAAEFLDFTANSPRLERLFTPEDAEAEAYALLRQYSDHHFSFVDATSFVWMRRLRLLRAFSFDRHFQVAGFTLVPGEYGP